MEDHTDTHSLYILIASVARSLVLHRSRLRCFWSRCLTSFSDYATTVLAAINMRWQSWFKRHAWLPWILAALRPASIFMYSTTPLQMKRPTS